MNLALAKTETGRALGEASPSLALGCPEPARSRNAQQAFEAYERAGLPHRRNEDWKYTDLRVLMREVLPLAAAPDPAALIHAPRRWSCMHRRVRRLVLVDGMFAPKLSDLGSLEKGLSIRTLREVLEKGDAALHAQLLAPDNLQSDGCAEFWAMMTDGVVIEVADGVVLTQPLHVVHIASGGRAGGDVHPLAVEARQVRRRHAGGKLYRRRWREGLSGPYDSLIVFDRRQRAARSCQIDRRQS